MTDSLTENIEIFYSEYLVCLFNYFHYSYKMVLRDLRWRFHPLYLLDIYF